MIQLTGNLLREPAPVTEESAERGWVRLVRKLQHETADWTLAISANNPTSYTWIAAIQDNNKEAFPCPWWEPEEDEE